SSSCRQHAGGMVKDGLVRRSVHMLEARWSPPSLHRAALLGCGYGRRPLSAARMIDPVNAYHAKASVLAARYEAVAAETVHAALLSFLPQGAGLLALDVGAGSGRDAAWLAGLGYEVVAVE